MSSIREVAEKIANDWHLHGLSLKSLSEAIKAALDTERERCAEIAETHNKTHSSGYRCYEGEVIAAAIRKED